jgi:hypothetical protein
MEFLKIRLLLLLTCLSFGVAEDLRKDSSAVEKQDNIIYFCFVLLLLLLFKLCKMEFLTLLLLVMLSQTFAAKEDSSAVDYDHPDLFAAYRMNGEEVQLEAFGSREVRN